MISHYGNKGNPAYSNKLSLIRWFIDFWYNSCNLGTPCIILVEGKTPFLKTLIVIGKKRKLDYIKLFKINVCLDLHSYPYKYLNFFLCSPRVAPDMNFEIMTSCLPIKLNWTLPCALTSLKIDLAVNSLLQTPLTIKILLLLGQFFLQIIFGYLQYKLGFYSEQCCVRKISI